MTLLVILLILVVCALLVILFLKQRPRQLPDETISPITMMQQQIEALRTDVRSSMQHVTDNLNQQLVAVGQQLQSQTQSVGNRLDNAARVIGDVQKNLGELGKATEEIKELGMSVSKLEELLRAPKLRGGLGEYLLEDLLKQILPAQHIEMQYRFRNGSIVDAVIRTSDRLVPIDSKFPLENFRKMMTTNIETEKKTFQKAFIGDVKKHIDAIATKYILPDEGTFPFALMYIPAENIYYEIIIKDEFSNDAGIYSYALSKNVVPVSPNSFYAYLQVIALGLRGMAIEHSARDIINALSRLQGDVQKVRDAFDILGTHLDNAQKKYDDADKRLSNFEARLENVSEQRLTEGQPKVPVHPEQLLAS